MLLSNTPLCEKCLQSKATKNCEFHFETNKTIVTKSGIKEIDVKHIYCDDCYNMFHKNCGKEGWL